MGAAQPRLVLLAPEKVVAEVASELVAVDAFVGDERFIATVAGDDPPYLWKRNERVGLGVDWPTGQRPVR